MGASSSKGDGSWCGKMKDSQRVKSYLALDSRASTARNTSKEAVHMVSFNIGKRPISVYLVLEHDYL